MADNAVLPTVVIADDEALVRDALSESLANEGWHCVSFACASEALGYVRSNPCSVVVADIQMPNNEQLELVEGVAAMDSFIPMILITGFPTVATALRAMALPVTAFLVKPFRTIELIDWVKVCLRKRAIFEAVQARAFGLDNVALSPDELRWLMDVLLPVLDSCRVGDEISDAERAECYRTMLERTVDVLSKTRSRFKSRELGGLRRDLEAVLRQSL